MQSIQKKLERFVKHAHFYRPIEDINHQNLKSINSCIINEEFGLALPFKMVPFFFNHLTGEEIESTTNMEKSKLTMENCRLKMAIQGHTLRHTESISGLEDFKARLLKLQQGRVHVMVNELQKVDIASPIRLIIQVRLYLEMKHDDYNRFLQSSYPEGAHPASTLKTRFKNCLSSKARKEFVEGGTHLEDKKIGYLQSLDLIGAREKRDRIEELDKLEKMKFLLNGFTMIEEIGLAVKSYICRPNPDKVELRLDFKFPTTSLESFELEVEGLKII